MDFVERITRTQFLGAEFITWLWYLEEENQGRFDLGGEMGEIELWFEDKLSMGSTAFDEQRDTFSGGKPTLSLEARVALKLGKLASSARVRVVQGEQEWTLNLKADPMMMSAIKLPEVLAKDPNGQFYERMFLLEHIDKIYRNLYRQFLELRLSPDWTRKILPELQTWVTGQRPTGLIEEGEE